MVAKRLPLSIDSPLKAVIYIKTAVEIVFKKGEHHKLANYSYDVYIVSFLLILQSISDNFSL